MKGIWKFSTVPPTSAMSKRLFSRDDAGSRNLEVTTFQS